MHLHIATPMYGGNCKGVYLDGLMALTFELAKKGYQVSFSKIYNESLITRARNNLVHEFEKSGADALLFVDGDEGFDHMDVISMIESERYMDPDSPYIKYYFNDYFKLKTTEENEDKCKIIYLTTDNKIKTFTF